MIVLSLNLMDKYIKKPLLVAPIIADKNVKRINQNSE